MLPLEKLKIPFCFTTCLRCPDAHVRISCHFILIMQAQWLAVWVETTIRYIKYVVRFFFFLSRAVCKICCCLQRNLLLENFYIFVKCSAVWNGRIREGSFGMDMTFLLRTVFNGLGFIQFPALRTSDTDTWLLQSWRSHFDVTCVGRLQWSFLWFNERRGRDEGD
jgi:hypothetical protein